MRGLTTAAVCLAAVAFSGLRGGVRAQQSADAIINALKPADNFFAGSARGIKPDGAPAPSETHPTTSETSSPASRPQVTQSATDNSDHLAAPSVNLTVNFPNGSAELTPSARASLDALGKALASSELESFRFRIEGHTDNVGSREENLTLSQRRAEAVVSYLTSQYNVAPARLEAVGMGQEHPLVETPPQTPEARNRRVQVINLGV